MESKNNILQFARQGKTDSTAKKPEHPSSLTHNNKVQKSMTPEGPLGDLIKFTTQWTDNAVSTLFDNVDTQLFEMAEKAENTTDQNIYFDAMRIIRLRRSAAYEEFANQISQSFTREAIQKEKTAEDLSAVIEDLSLVADDSLEEDLAIHNMIAKAERDHKENLQQLNQRLAYLYDGLKINIGNNPIGPTSLCHSFARAVNTLEAEIKVKLLVFKLFDLNFITNIHELYEPTNQLLITNNILPNLKVSYKGAIKKQASSAAGSASGSVAESGADDGLASMINTPVQNNPEDDLQDNSGLSQFIQQPAGINSNTEDAQAFALIQQLINQHKPAQQQLPVAQYASTNDVISSLSQLQNMPEVNGQYNIGQGNSTTTTSNLLKAALTESLLSNQHKQAINQSDDNLIDVIGMLFDFILDDDKLADSVKSLISRLQIPIIKIALQENVFFKNKNHPARKLLNELANAGLGVTNNVSVRNNPLYLKLENIVNHISNEQTEKCDAAFFENLLENLRRFLTQFNQGLTNKKGPSKDAALKLVTTELSSRISTKELPHNIVLLLERVWKDVMFDIFFTDSMESDEWDMAMTFVDTLIWSMNPKLDVQGQKQLVRVIPGILNALNAGLDRVHYPKELREQILQDLQDCHLACMKGKAIKDSQLSQNDTAYISSKRLQNKKLKNTAEQISSSEPDSTTASLLENNELTPEELEDIDAGVDIMLNSDLSNLDALDEENLLTSLEDGSEQAIADNNDTAADSDVLIEDDYTQQARNLSSGAWLEFQGSDDKTYRAKISWMSEDASAYIFVTQTGQVAEKSLQGLSNALRSKQATILDETPVFERAMDAVLEELQETTDH